jgi:hypothetical protein
VTGVLAWLTLAAILNAIPAGRAIGHYVRWHLAAAREEAARWAASEDRVRAELADALAERAVRAALREHRSAGRAETARALRPVGYPIDSR